MSALSRKLGLAATILGMAALPLVMVPSAPAKTAAKTAAKAVPIDAAKLSVGERAFAQCKACHAISATGRDTVGPNLYGIYGAKAGGHSATFKYSAAMQASGLTWNDATLDNFLAGPAKAVPGTKMAYRGVTDTTTRAALVYYIKMTSSAK